VLLRVKCRIGSGRMQARGMGDSSPIRSGWLQAAKQASDVTRMIAVRCLFFYNALRV
jgi:hypothetical protein